MGENSYNLVIKRNLFNITVTMSQWTSQLKGEQNYNFKAEMSAHLYPLFQIFFKNCQIFSLKDIPPGTQNPASGICLWKFAGKSLNLSRHLFLLTNSIKIYSYARSDLQRKVWWFPDQQEPYARQPEESERFREWWFVLLQTAPWWTSQQLKFQQLGWHPKWNVCSNVAQKREKAPS